MRVKMHGLKCGFFCGMSQKRLGIISKDSTKQCVGKRAFGGNGENGSTFYFLSIYGLASMDLH